jgi:hypothetical protein
VSDHASRLRPRQVAFGILAAILGGLALRVGMVAEAPRYGYAWDHFEVLGMGLVAAERGLPRAYSAPADALPTLRGWIYRDGAPVTISRRGVYPPNYPPIATTVFWAQSRWLDAGASDFVANSPHTRLVTSLAPWMFELATAIGVGLLAQALGTTTLGALGAALTTWLAPPLMMNTVVFGQYDALALAPGVFALLAMVRGRWVLAGIAVGIGLLAKPQGLLMLPVAAFAALVAAPTGLGAIARRAAAIGAAAVLTVLIGGAPWMLADGLDWVRRCYRMNLFEVLPFTTLEAYNVWYLFGLIAERRPVYDILSSTAVVAGMTRDAWGRCLLATALVASAALAWRQRRRPALAIALFAALWLWSIFVWPTRVHERYILYSVPVLIALAASVPRFRPAALAVLLLATMEHGWMIWRSGPTLGSFDRGTVQRLHDERFQAFWKGRPFSIEAAKQGPKLEESTALAFDRYRQSRRGTARLEWALTLLSLGAYAWAVAVAATLPTEDERDPAMTTPRAL